MKVLLTGLAVLLVVYVSVAQGQYWGGYIDNHASTAGEGYARGMGDLVRSQGMANLDNSEAAINMTEAASRTMDNRQKWTDTYFQMRDANKKYRAQERGPKTSMEAAVRYAQAGKPKLLSPSDLDRVDGEISWPLLLKDARYADARTELEALFAKRAELGGITIDDYFMINRVTKSLLDQLKSQVRDVPAAEYVAAKRFVESLTYEANRPPS